APAPDRWKCMPAPTTVRIRRPAPRSWPARNRRSRSTCTSAAATRWASRRTPRAGIRSGSALAAGATTTRCSCARSAAATPTPWPISARSGATFVRSRWSHDAARVSCPAMKTYDRRYFDRWYRSPGERVGSRAELARKVAMVVHLAEYYLGRPLHNVLDVGCGEAPWRAPLLRLRPKLDYRGLDASEYVVARYGRTRNIGLAAFGDLAELRFDTRFDLIVCSDVLHYVGSRELRRGLRGFGELLEGVAFL